MTLPGNKPTISVSIYQKFKQDDYIERQRGIFQETFGDSFEVTAENIIKGVDAGLHFAILEHVLITSGSVWEAHKRAHRSCSIKHLRDLALILMESYLSQVDDDQQRFCEMLEREAEVSEEGLLQAIAAGLDIQRVAEQVLANASLADFDRMAQDAKDTYAATVDPAWKAYQAVTEPIAIEQIRRQNAIERAYDEARAIYERDSSAASAAYNEVQRPAYCAYHQVQQHAQEEYARTIARAFVSAYSHAISNAAGITLTGDET